MPDARIIARLRFPPWQVCELEGGYAVEDAAGHRLGTFYGKLDPVEARQAGLLTLEEARQTAIEFARLADLVDQALKAEGLKAESLDRSARPRHTRKCRGGRL
jgi:hypothetical protein